MEDQKRINIVEQQSDHCQSEKEAYDFFIKTMVQIVENWIVLRSLRSFTYHIFLILEVQNEQRRKEMCPVSESKYGNAGGWI